MYSNERGYSSDVEQFVTSIRLRALEDCSFGYRTNAQAQKLAIQIQQTLRNPENRKAVLQALTGLPIGTQNELTFWYHHVLIDELQEEADADLLRAIEDIVEATAGSEPWALFPWYWPLPAMPDLQLAYY